MATDETNNGKNGKNGSPEGTGWVDVRPSMAQAFFRVEEGAQIQGVLKGRFPKPGNRKGFIYQILTTTPCKAMVKIDDDYEVQDVPAGTLVSIDERSSLEGLKEAADDPNEEFEVFICANEKKTLTNGNKFWDMTVLKRPFVAPF